MAHDIAYNSATGKHMVFTAGQLPWHNLGQNVKEAKSWREAIQLAQLDWKVVEAPIYTHWTQSGQIKIEGYKAIVRADTKQTLGIHSIGYNPFQNEQAFTFADDLLNNGAGFDSAGGLGKGERIWCLARVPQADFTIGNGDKHESYLLVATSHDGSLAFTATLTDVRVVCNNTLRQALGVTNNKADLGQWLKIRHTSGGQAKLTEAQRLIAKTIAGADVLKQKLIQLSTAHLTKESTVAILDRLFPVKDPAADQSKRNNVIREVVYNMERNDNNMFPDQKGTAYSLLNAITDYTDHTRGTRRDDQAVTVAASRSESAMFGSGAKLKTQALDVIYQTVASGELGVPDSFNLEDLYGLN